MPRPGPPATPSLRREQELERGGILVSAAAENERAASLARYCDDAARSRAISTEHGAWRTTGSATLPQPARACRVRVPVTARASRVRPNGGSSAQLQRCARRRISIAGIRWADDAGVHVFHAAAYAAVDESEGAAQAERSRHGVICNNVSKRAADGRQRHAGFPCGRSSVAFMARIGGSLRAGTRLSVPNWERTRHRAAAVKWRGTIAVAL